jgi:chloramphenicol-sensitive protein RarD
MSFMNKGLFYAIGAYTVWGLLPVYWKALQTVPATEIVGHRMVWSLVFVTGLLVFRRHWGWLRVVAREPRRLLVVFLAACILGLNWLTYVWAVNAGYIVETSLGYFINPLVSVLLGVVFLRERLRHWQWAAIGVACIGVLYLTLGYGALPWIALVLAFTFGFYGLLKKKTSLGALEGLAMEVSLLFLPALAYLLYLDSHGTGSFGQTTGFTSILLILTGVATGGPLLLFAAAAKRIPLSMLGILQYIAPTLQFLLGVFLYGESFNQTRLVGFSLIWTALLIYSIEGGLVRRRKIHLQYSD